jgi:NADP-dependent 3-hydroxy acid dehydrogenase YdfG
VAGARREDRLAALVGRVRDAGGSIDVRRLDVTDRPDVAVAEHGRGDVIVNNAGVMPMSRLDALRVDQWDQMLDVNVRGLLHGIAATLPHFQRQGGGHCITMGSTGAHELVPTGAV